MPLLGAAVLATLLTRRAVLALSMLARRALLAVTILSLSLLTLWAILTLGALLSALLTHLRLRPILLAALGFVSLQVLLVLERLSTLSAAILFPLLLLHVLLLGQSERKLPLVLQTAALAGSCLARRKMRRAGKNSPGPQSDTTPLNGLSAPAGHPEPCARRLPSWPCSRRPASGSGSERCR